MIGGTRRSRYCKWAGGRARQETVSGSGRGLNAFCILQPEAHSDSTSKLPSSTVSLLLICSEYPQDYDFVLYQTGLLGIIRYYPVLSGIIRSSQVSSGLLRYHEDFSGIIRYYQASSGTIRSSQVLSGLLRYHQVLSYIGGLPST